MLIELRVERAFHDPFSQLRDQPVLAEHIFFIVTGLLQQLVDHVVHLRAHEVPS